MKSGVIRYLNFLLFTVLFCLSGCYSYKPVPVPVNGETYTGIKKDEQQTVPKDCKLLTLSLAQDIALANNPDFISKQHAFAAAKARYYQSLSAYLPTISSSYAFANTYNNPTENHMIAMDRENNYTQTMALQGQWLIFDGLQRTMNMLARKHAANQSKDLEEDSKRLLIEAVANAYNEVLLEVEKNRIAEADLVFQKKQLKETQIKYEAGAVPLSDVLNFKGKAIDAENNMIIAYYRHRTAKYALADLMGLTEGAISDTVKFPPLKDASETPLIDIGAYLDAALHNRPDLKSYREAVESAEYTMYSRWGAFSPSATLVGSLSYSRNKARIDSRNGRQPDSYDKRYRNRQYSYGVNVNWTLFEGGSRFARLREAQANVADTQYQLAQMWLDVVKDVRNAYDNYNKTIKQLRLFSQALEVQTKIRDLVEEEYKAGNTSLVRLNEAQRDLVQAETDYVSAKINLHNAQAQLGAAINSNDIFFKGAGVKEMAPAQDKNAKPLPDLKVPVADPVKN